MIETKGEREIFDLYSREQGRFRRRVRRELCLATSTKDNKRFLKNTQGNEALGLLFSALFCAGVLTEIIILIFLGTMQISISLL